MSTRPFIVENWTRRLDEMPQRRITFTPNYRTFFSRLIYTLILWVCAALFIGVDYELRRMRTAHRMSPAEIEESKRGYDHQIKVERQARGEAAAEKLRGELYAFVDGHAAKKAAYADGLEKQHALWHQLIYGAMALLAGWGAFVPLSLLWRRLWIHREGDDLVFVYRGMVMNRRERRVGVHAAAQPRVTVQEIRVRVKYGWVSDGYRWEVTLTDGPRTVVVHPRRSKAPVRGALDPGVDGLLRDLRGL